MLGSSVLSTHENVEPLPRGVIRACLDGDPGAWEALIRRCGALIYSVPRRAGLSERDAAGVFQEVCHDLWRGLPAMGDHPKPGVWLITVAARHTWRRLQRRRRPGGMPGDARRVETPELDETMVEELTPGRVA